MSINIRDLPRYLDSQKVPLILDPSGRVDIFFYYSPDHEAVLVDLKKLFVSVFVFKTMPIDKAQVHLAESVSAAKAKILVLAMQDTLVKIDPFLSEKCTLQHLLQSKVVITSELRDAQKLLPILPFSDLLILNIDPPPQQRLYSP